LRGRHISQPRKLTHDRLAHVRKLSEDDEERAGVAALLGVGVAPDRRALKKGT
jgi:hypothetical protein